MTSSNEFQEYLAQIDYVENMRALYRKYNSEKDKYNRLGVIRQYYMDHAHEIISLAEKSPTQFLDIYPFDWMFNLNEKGLWSDIRNSCTVFYPEFPIFNLHADFANPYFRLILEADSDKYHDPVKDKERDLLLAKFGWTTFRFQFKETQATSPAIGDLVQLRRDDEAEYLDAIEQLMLSTSTGALRAIEFFYFLSSQAREKRLKLLPEFAGLAKETLQQHCSTKWVEPELV